MPKRSASNALAGHDALPLRTVSAVTGLTPDVIRAWEKRYRVVSPVRGMRGARLYSSDDIARLRLLATVVESGRAIGDVAKLPEGELQRLARSAPAASTSTESAGPAVTRGEASVDRILEALRAYNEPAVGRWLSDALVALGARAFVYDLVLPLIERVGREWRSGSLSIAEEHLLTGLLRNLLAGLIPRGNGSGPVVVLATPSGERHEIGLLLLALVARDSGVRAVYLGLDVPASEIAHAAARLDARVVALSIAAVENHEQATSELVSLSARLDGSCELWVGGSEAKAAASSIRSFRGIVFDSLERAENELARVAAAHVPAAIRPARRTK